MCFGWSALAHSGTGDRCEALASQRLPVAARIVSESVPAGGLARTSLEVPAFCRVRGELTPAEGSHIGFELWLPASGWSGRYYQLGTGGFAGGIHEEALLAELKAGNAAAMTDTGHQADPFDASWAQGHPERIVDYGYRSVPVTAEVAQALVQAYYGRAARYRYFAGCSNGGRQALMTAQRNPQLWNGILVGAPAYDWTRQLASFAWIQHQLRATAAGWIGAEKLPAIQRAALDSCTRAAGVVEGVPADPRLCHFDARALLCRAQERDDCLTAAQVESLEAIVHGSPGQDSLFGFEPTSAAVPDNWERWIVNPDRQASSQLTFAETFYGHVVLGDAAWKVEDFRDPGDFGLAARRLIDGRSLAAVLDARNADLGVFERDGGKLLMYFGWADAVLAPRAALAYYERVARRMGGMARTQRFFRLFTVPGMTHCQGGTAPDAFGQAAVSPPLSDDPRHDIRRALERWVERGEPPGSLVAVRHRGEDAGQGPEATQLLCPFPRRAQIARAGDPHSASTYACVDP